jgi:CO/xanthine dehydrogenase Mo-binding subunit
VSRVIDTPEYRVEGYDKVTGRAKYTADIRRDGMLEAAYLRSPHAHARVVSVDTSDALAMPGVHAVLTGADVRPAHLGRRLQDWPLLAWDRVRFIGDRVAVVAADSLAQAEAAAACIAVEYEILPAVFDPVDALANDQIALHPDAASYHTIGSTGAVYPHPNIQGRAAVEHGDVDLAFEQAARTFEHTFDTPRTFQGYLEPHASVVWMENGRFHVISTNKAPFKLREQLSASLGLREDEFVIQNTYIGADFGGKGFSIDEYVLVLLTRASGRPVRYLTKYADDLRATNTRHAAHLRLRTAVDAENRITAHIGEIVFDGGAYAAAKPGAALVPGGAPLTLPGYRVPNARMTCTAVYTNNVPGGHARTPGAPQTSFAAESHIDLIARELAIDPLEFRLLNAIRPGEPDVSGKQWHDPSMVDVLERLRAGTDWTGPTPRGRGRGYSIGIRHAPGGPDGNARLSASVTPDGCVEILTGVPDQGGGSHTAMQRVAADALGLDLNRIRIRQGNTDEALYDAGAGGGRVTPITVGGAWAAAVAMKARLEELAPGEPVAKQVDRAAYEGGISVEAEFAHDNAGLFSTCAYAVEVEVDPDTGRVRITDCVLVVDTGTVINPIGFRGQLVGGFSNGVGQALMEEISIVAGTVLNPNLETYKLPTMLDTPPLRIIELADHKGNGPFGAKSIAELTNVSIAPAIANAIHDATGVRVTSLPLTPEKILFPDTAS